MAKVFVSYSRKDSVVARKLIEALGVIQQDVWVDWEDIPPAVDWLDQIFRGIEGSDVFIFLVSPDSIASEVCNVEVGRAALNNKRIIPIVLRDVEAKSANETIRKLNWIFLRETDVFDEVVQKVKTAIELDLPWVEEHNRLQLRALDWHRRKDVSLLLRGRDLREARKMVLVAVNKEPKPTQLQELYLKYSHRTERNRIALWIATALTVLVLGVLSYVAFVNAKEANHQKNIAQVSEQRAIENAVRADQNAADATNAKDLAQKNENTAKAQRSAALAQIYQGRPGELYTSTLLAIDSWNRAPSPQAEDILRKNISLLPIPVAQGKQSDGINQLVFDSNGDKFITASEDGTACLWNLKDGKQLFCSTSPGSVNDAAFSPDGTIVATGDSSGEVLILDALSGEVQNQYNYDVPIWGVNISPTGEDLAIARDDGKITFINLKTRKFSFQLETLGSLHVSVFSPNGEWIAAGTSEGIVTVWNLHNGRIVREPHHKGPVLALAFSPDGKLLVSGGKDSTAIVAVTFTGNELFRVFNEDAVEDVAFSPDNDWFVTVSDDHRIRVWDSDSGQERLRILQESVVTQVEVSANAQWIATMGSDKTLHVWNAASGAEIFQIPLAHNGSVMSFTADEKYLVSGDQGGDVNIWDISEILTPVSSIRFDGFTTAAQFSPSGDWLAAAAEEQIWLLDKGNLPTLLAHPQGERLPGINGQVQKLLISPNSKWIAISTDAGDIFLYNVEGKNTARLQFSDTAPSFVFSIDGSQLITGGTNGIVQVWDLASGKPIGTLYEAHASVMSLAVSQNLLAIGLSDQIMLLDLEDGSILSQIKSTGDHLFLAFNTDGSLLASANSFGQIEIWKQSGTGFELARSITRAQVFSMRFNPKGDQLFVGETDVLYILDPLTGGEIARIPHKDAVRDISFSADGTLLATASVKVIEFWDVQRIPVISADNLVGTACNRLIHNFDPDQWKALFDEENYKRLCENLSAPQ